LRAVFPLQLDKNSVITHQIAFGELQRPEGEFAAQNYIRCEDDEKGLAIINKGMPGNNATDNVIMLSLMRSAYQEYLDPCDDALEEGETHFFEYAILPYKTKNRPDFARIALEFNTPPIVCRGAEAPAANPSETELSATFAGFNVSASEIVNSAIYAEGDATVIRLYNSTARAVKCEISIPGDATKFSETNALLEKSANIAVDSGKAIIDFKPFEVKTFKCVKD
jgi:alpha-mannosidase